MLFKIVCGSATLGKKGKNERIVLKVPVVRGKNIPLKIAVAFTKIELMPPHAFSLHSEPISIPTLI